MTLSNQSYVPNINFIPKNEAKVYEGVRNMALRRKLWVNKLNSKSARKFA